MTARLPRRYRAAAGTPRRQPRIRRASSGFTPTRSAALLAMLATAGAVFGLATTPAFSYSRLEVRGALLTTEEEVRAAASLEPGVNLVSLGTETIAGRLRQLPSVRDAQVSIVLPDTIRVALDERRAIVIWGVGSHRYAVDESGLLFADVTTDPSGAAAAIPTVLDERDASIGLAVGSALDPVVRDAATRLGSVTPSDVGSTATRFQVAVTDERGFTLSSGPGGWLAIFGFYGRSQRTPALIPGQLQLLSGLLAGRENRIETVILADEHEGTFVPKPTPKPSATPRP